MNIPEIQSRVHIHVAHGNLREDVKVRPLVFPPLMLVPPETDKTAANSLLASAISSPCLKFAIQALLDHNFGRFKTC